MTALALEAAPFIRMVAPKMQALYRAFLRALDDFTKSKMRNAVPEWELRRVQREVNRYRRLMHANRAAPVGTARAGR